MVRRARAHSHSPGSVLGNKDRVNSAQRECQNLPSLESHCQSCNLQLKAAEFVWVASDFIYAWWRLHFRALVGTACRPISLLLVLSAISDLHRQPSLSGRVQGHGYVVKVQVCITKEIGQQRGTPKHIYGLGIRFREASLFAEPAIPCFSLRVAC